MQGLDENPDLIKFVVKEKNRVEHSWCFYLPCIRADGLTWRSTTLEIGLTLLYYYHNRVQLDNYCAHRKYTFFKCIVYF